MAAHSGKLCRIPSLRTWKRCDCGCHPQGGAMKEKLQDWAAQRGYRVAWGPGAVIEGVRREVKARKSGSEIDEHFYEQELKSVLAAGNENAGKTVVIVAAPCAAHRIRFNFEGKVFEALLPPTYFRYRALFEEIRMDLARNGLPGAQVEYLVAPLKVTAARLGLVVYGRNNICYVPGLGSYFQLCGYLTDAMLPKMQTAGVFAASLLPQCDGCVACISICPTGAITEDRILLRAERCLTFANENAGDWPDWVNPRAHNSILGCLECQRVCPANPELTIEDTGLTFSSAETQLLISEKGKLDARAETGIRSKLAWLGQSYSEPVFGRNLHALMQARDFLKPSS